MDAKSGYTFDPASISYNNVTAEQTGQNCVASEVAAGPAEWTAYNDCVYDVTQDDVETNPNGQRCVNMSSSSRLSGTEASSANNPSCTTF